MFIIRIYRDYFEKIFFMAAYFSYRSYDSDNLSYM